MKHGNDDAAAYTFLMVGILLIIAAIVWSFLAIGLNPVIDIHNTYTANGQVSVQSHNLAVWSIAFILGVPGITMIGLWIYSVNRAVEVSQAGSF
jgi:hypothetical protein